MAEVRQRLRVIEIAQGYAGPVCGRLFAGLGHEVIKIEPPGGDYLRADGTSRFAFAAVNAGKRSRVIDFGNEADRTALAALIDSAQVVIVDGGRKVLRSLGLVERTAERCVISIGNFGLDETLPQTRPDSLLAEGFGGLATMIGEPDRPPLELGGEQGAHA